MRSFWLFYRIELIGVAALACGCASTRPSPQEDSCREEFVAGWGRVVAAVFAYAESGSVEQRAQAREEFEAASATWLRKSGDVREDGIRDAVAHSLARILAAMEDGDAEVATIRIGVILDEMAAYFEDP